MSTLEIKTFTALREKLGEETTDVLMEYISAKSEGVMTEDKAKASFPTEDRLRQIFATKEDLARLETNIEAGFNTQLKWLILLMLGFSSLIRVVAIMNVN